MRLLLKENVKQIADEFSEGHDIIKRGTVIEMWRAMSILEAAMKQNIRVRSGLRVRSGTLLNSIQKHVYQESGQVIGKIGPENVPYAAIHEEGGIIPARRVEPRHGKALRWVGGDGKVFFSKGHMLPAVAIRARPYVAPAYEEKEEIIREKFRIFLSKSLEKN